MWLGHIPRTGTVATSELMGAVAAFETAVPRATELRNMLEHEDEYTHGVGHRQADYVAQVGGMPASAHSVTVIGLEKYVIGGRVDLKDTVSALEQLQPALVNALPPAPPPVFEINIPFVG